MTVLTQSEAIGSALERDRLEHRAVRLRRAIAALEDRRTFRRHPGALRQAVASFRAELDDVERRLAELAAS